MLVKLYIEKYDSNERLEVNADRRTPIGMRLANRAVAESKIEMLDLYPVTFENKKYFQVQLEYDLRELFKAELHTNYLYIDESSRNNLVR